MPTVADIITEYGAYYEKSGQNKNRILKILTQKTETTEIMSSAKTDETIFKFAKGSVTSLLQPFQKAWTAKGAVTFKPRKIELAHMKMDFEEWPDDIEATWLGFLADNNLKRSEWPLIRYMIEEYLFPQLRADFELNVAFKGVQKDVTPGVAGNPIDVLDGFQELLRAGVADGTMNQVTGIGTLDENTIFDQVEAFTKGFSEIYQGVPMTVNMSKRWERAYLTDKRANGFYQISGEGQINKKVDFVPQEVKGLASMAGSNVLWATPKANMVHLTKKDINKNKVNIEESKRQVFLMTDWWEGIGFGINEIVWTTYGTGSGSGSV